MTNKTPNHQEVETVREKRAKYRKMYIEKNPWTKHYSSAMSRAKVKGRDFTMSTKDFKELWFRDKAFLMERPSIDRLDDNKGYIKENCQFLELKENSAKGNRGRKNTRKQREAGRKNLNNWREEIMVSNTPKSRNIVQKDLNGVIVKIWACNKDITKLGFDSGNITHCCKGRQKTYKGYRWEYAPLTPNSLPDNKT